MKNLLFFIVSFFVLCSTACHKTQPGDPNKFTTLNAEEVTSSNMPEGLELKENALHPKEGYELVPSKDGHRVMLMSKRTGLGVCDCDCKCIEGAGSCDPIGGIVGCTKTNCDKCKSLLHVYDRPISFDRAKW